MIKRIFKKIAEYWFISLASLIIIAQLANIIVGEKLGVHLVIPFIEPAFYIVAFALVYKMLKRIKIEVFNFEALPIVKAWKIGANIIGYILLILLVESVIHYWRATDSIYYSSKNKIELYTELSPTDYVYSLYRCRSYVCKKIDIDLSYSEDNSFTGNMKLIPLQDSSLVAVVRGGIISDVVNLRNETRIDMPYVNMKSDTAGCSICNKLKFN